MPAVPKPPKRIKNKDIYQEVALRDGCQCLHCGRITSYLQPHHIVYRSQGGHDTLDNLISLCVGCHELAHNNSLSVSRPALRDILTKQYGYVYEEGELK